MTPVSVARLSGRRLWSRRRRLCAKRAWALGILRVHVEDADGGCELCTTQFGSTHPWPCLPAQVAQFYLDRPHD